jgi:hypothetical protein
MLERFTLSRTVRDLYDVYRRLRDRKTRRFYNPLRSLLRMVVAAPVAAYIAFRLLFVDMYWRVHLTTRLKRIKRITHGLYRRTLPYPQPISSSSPSLRLRAPDIRGCEVNGERFTGEEHRH